MSLVLSAIYSEGILLAADPFVFDNDGDAPSKGVDFRKVLVDEKKRSALAGVGSAWALQEAIEHLKTLGDSPFPDLLPSLADRWRDLNGEWRAKREAELAESGETTLRPLSKSVLIAASFDDLSIISVVDPEGTVSRTKSYVLSGSGADIVRHHLKSSGKTFRPGNTLKDSLALLRECYRVAAHDLYVIGFPTLAIVTKEGVRDLSTDCESLWRDCEERYFDGLEKVCLDIT